ncbi:phospholipid-translocating P-type ATPase [Aureobasidium pullulans]|uniref:Phospholipid-transporting ATPase n=1 Tax=Aureobasidium pullulans TaxID=5580 RepID=A0A4V4J7C6_AURPU|nr:phospholipid-translocating P-type ATPase [Aureobasidium pullulans]THX79263.1 phospholipid-translocating P-type ATPase [Aureobasidium pullulans]THY93105.1 phospholipid-translocating P-type ATPase [Aureobasidium pullulans]TIA39188.1 phospholipid-translocating P-type ATPase [Aureobasidium pullulans]
MAIQPYQEDNEASSGPHDTAPAKRLRWATQRVAGSQGGTKRQSILRRLSHKKRTSDDSAKRESNGTDLESVPEGSEASADQSGPGRRVFFNMPLPEDARDEEGHPNTQFVRNKIRTAKYTPISFIPKNLWFQFHNIANIYFLFIIILSIFPIFGATNPGLSAVPLIVIVFITAVKDGIEDWRRTVLDNELNNAPAHRLVDWENVNTAEDQISLWRKFKKANTRAITSVWRLWKNRKEPKDEKRKSQTDRALDEGRPSTDTRRPSMYSQRMSAMSIATEEPGAMEMTPVHSPMPAPAMEGNKEMDFGDHVRTSLENDASKPGDARQVVEVAKDPTESNAPIPKRFYGNVINPNKPAGKARFKKDCWKNVQVGDFVRLYNEESIPADIVVLSTSDPDGACYVETKNLDGETNLKVRQALHCSQKVKRARDCERAEFILESEPPHANLYSYSGAIRWKQQGSKNSEVQAAEMAEPVSINNMLLRGCSIRNTEWVLGIVVFTGEETKIMLNSGITPTKRAQISKDLNWNVIYNFIILFFMCLISALVQGTTWGKGNESLDFFEFGSYGGTPGLNGFITFWAAIILFQNLVPISLYISLEIVRTAQAFFIYSDTFMYYAPVDYPCTPKSWNISDDLGQIEYIFSDKTGTLTQNVMEFKKVTINGVPYGEAYTEALAGMQKRQGIDTDVEGAKAREQIARGKVKMLEDLRKIHNNPYLLDENVTFVAPDYISDLTGASGPQQKAANEYFMLVLALCHTVITERTPGDPPKLEFKAQSPDEAALVATARDCGFTVLGRSNDGIIVNVLGEEREYTVLNILEFNSSRKRMSAIVRMPNGKIVLFCKGADSIIYSRLKKGEQQELRKTTADHLEMFAREGLRTLCIAQRELDEEEYQIWNKQHDIAAAAIQNREEKLEEVSDAIERDLTLLGGTAIEDRLQDGVPDAIQLLAQAGIKLWVLTGDKVETAINIGFSCNLLGNDMDLIVLNIQDENLATAEAELDKNLAIFGKTGSDEELKAAKKNHEPPAPTHAVVVDGETLKLMLDDKLRQKFLLLCKECKSVLCCRVSPSQKAAVVGMVKNGLDVMTLSIGDGANDVAMIQKAHVGVGIAGEEGRQAVMSSDYAIGQFRFLTRLVLNIIWTFALFWYQIFANFDCSYIFDYSYILLYNLAFTSLPVILMGILDQDVDDKVSLAVPQLYRRGIERKEWTQIKFWTYMIDGLYQSLVCFFLPYLLFRPANFNTESGQNVNDYQRIGVYIANATVVVANVYILMNTYRWDWFFTLITTISILLIWTWTGIYSSFTVGFTFYKAGAEAYGSLSFWALTMMVIIVALLPRFAAKSFQKIFMPRDIDVIREQIRQGKFDYLKNVNPDGPNGVTPPSPEKGSDSTSSSEISKPSGAQRLAHKLSHNRMPTEDERPIYPPSIAATATTRNARSHNGSDGTDYTGHRSSIERTFPAVGQVTSRPSEDFGHSPIDFYRPPVIAGGFESPAPRPSYDRPRPSFDRLRASMDFERTRPSFESSRDFTSAAYLSRVESSHTPAGTPGVHEDRKDIGYAM